MSPGCGPTASTIQVETGIVSRRSLLGVRLPRGRGVAPAGPALVLVVAHLSSRRSSFPDAVRGRRSATSTAFGTLKRASRSPTNARSSSGSARLAQDDAGGHGLAPLGVGAGEDGGVGDGGVLEQGGLDLGGRDVLAAGDDRVGLAADRRCRRPSSKRPRSPVCSVPPPATVGPVDEDLAVGGELDADAGQRAAVDGHLRARLREPVGLGDGPAGRAAGRRVAAAPPSRTARSRAPGRAPPRSAAGAGSGPSRRA